MGVSFRLVESGLFQSPDRTAKLYAEEDKQETGVGLISIDPDS
jgi:hypothetical protein